MIEDIFDGGHRRVEKTAGPDDESSGLYPPEYYSTDMRYLVPSGKAWANWEDVNENLDFLTDEEVLEVWRANVRDLGDFEDENEAPFRERTTPRTADEAWALIDELWEGDPGGRGWHVRVPEGAQWVRVHNDDGQRGDPVPEWHSDAPPLTEGEWQTPGYGGSSFEGGLDDALGL
jgi:hypothetical protein